MKEKIAHIQSYIIYRIVYVIIHSNYENNEKVIFLITFLIHIYGQRLYKKKKTFMDIFYII